MPPPATPADQTPPTSTVIPPPPAPPPASPTPGVQEVDKTKVHDLFQRLIDTTEAEPEKKDPKETPPASPTPPKDPKEASPAAGAAAPDGRPIRVPKKAALAKRPDLPKAGTPSPAAPPSAAAPAPAAPAAAAPADDSDLLENEREMITQAKQVEEALGDKYRGLEAKTRGFVRAHAKYLEEHPEVDDENNQDAQKQYNDWMAKHAPTVAQADIKRAEEERIIKRAKTEGGSEVADLRHELYIRDETPKVEKEVQTYREKMFEAAMPDEILAMIRDKEHGGDVVKGVKKANETYSEEISLVTRLVNLASADIAEFVRISRVNPLNGRPLASTPTATEPERVAQHQRIGKIVEDVCEEFKNTATEAELVKDGRWYVTRNEWYSIPAAERGKFWTFSNPQIIDRAIKSLKINAANMIKANAEDMKKRGYQRIKPAAPAPGAPAQPPQGGAPARRPSPLPSGSPSPNPGLSEGATAIAGNLSKGD